MNLPYLLLVAMVSLLSGCVSRSSCSVVQTNSHQDVTLKLDVYGVVPQMCGVTSHATQKSILSASGRGPRYLGADVIEPARPDRKTLGGTMTVDHARHRVNVNLTYSNGEPYWMNGGYRITTTR